MGFSCFCCKNIKISTRLFLSLFFPFSSREQKIIFLWSAWMCCGMREKWACESYVERWGKMNEEKSTITEDSRKIISLCHPIYHFTVCDFSLWRRRRCSDSIFDFFCMFSSWPCLIQFNEHLFSFRVVPNFLRNFSLDPEQKNFCW